jgi:NAD(P)-dependent dehydrogenase (short-subunit alcohol dehydrogenase family)
MRRCFLRDWSSDVCSSDLAVNALRAGVTDTPALRKIPGNERLLEGAAKRNPSGRLTTPGDVASALVALCHPAAGWVTGNVINVDGGEEVSAG